MKQGFCPPSFPLILMITWHTDIRAPAAAYPSSPTMAALTQRFTWQMFTCITFKTPVSYLDWKSSQKDSVFAPFRSCSVSSAANYSTQIKNQFSCKVIWKYLTAWKSWLCLNGGLWIKQAIDHLKSLAMLHTQKTLSPSPVQSEHKTSKTLYVVINQTQQDTQPHSSWFCSHCICCS